MKLTNSNRIFKRKREKYSGIVELLPSSWENYRELKDKYGNENTICCYSRFKLTGEQDFLRYSGDSYTIIPLCTEKFIVIENSKIPEYTKRADPGFTKADRSSFPYWFAHWCAFQLTALNLGVWKPRFLLHDTEKPWLKLFWKYKKVQKFHRTHNKHHLTYGIKHGWDNVDWVALVVDWECSRLSKLGAMKDARQTLELEMSRGIYPEVVREKVEEVLNKLEL